MTTHPTLNTIYAAHRANLITFDAVVRKQHEQYPRCLPHDAIADGEIDGMAVCVQCYLEHRAYFTARLRGEP